MLSASQPHPAAERDSVGCDADFVIFYAPAAERDSVGVTQMSQCFHISRVVEVNQWL
jgi:hypothetical protein